MHGKPDRKGSFVELFATGEKDPDIEASGLPEELKQKLYSQKALTKGSKPGESLLGSGTPIAGAPRIKRWPVD